MARHFGLEGTGGALLSPSLLQLLVNRYDEDLDLRFGDYYDCHPHLVDHFNVARYVCKRLCEFDYRNYIWSVDGKDVKAPGGKSLRIMHPFYPAEAPYEHITIQETKFIMRVLAKAAKAKTLEEFGIIREVPRGLHFENGWHRDEAEK
jgi:hypothetical protein